MKTQSGFTYAEFIILLVALFGFIGWVWNIVKIAGSDFTAMSAMLVLRCLGVLIAPLGAVLGYL